MLVVVIPAAGEGVRLERKMCKATVSVKGKPILAWQLDELKTYPQIEKVVIVVGFKGKFVKAIAEAWQEINFPDFSLKIVENKDWGAGGCLKSAVIGMENISDAEDVLVIDGDIVPKMGSMEAFMTSPGHWRIGVRRADSLATGSTVEAVVKEGSVVRFVHPRTNCASYVWGCAAKAPVGEYRKAASRDALYEYRALEPILPIPAVVMDAVEINTEQDLRGAQEWAK